MLCSRLLRAMATALRIPKATMTMEEGSIVQWLKTEGDFVSKDDVLFELETDKAILEVPAPSEGILLRITVPKGTARVEQVVGWIGERGEAIPSAEATSASEVPAPADAISNETPAQQRRVIATPAARRRASELGIDLQQISGTGPGGRITEKDVETAQAPVEPKPDRKAISSHVTNAWQTVPHIHIARELDATGLAKAHELRRDLSVTDLLLYVLSRMTTEFPAIVPTGDIAFAADTPRGVVTPVVHGATGLDIDAISRQRKELTQAARANRLKVQQLQGGAFTLTNLGMEDVDFFAPIINAPQAAILAVGAIRRKPVVIDDQIVVGSRMWANLAVDHRTVDGVYAARFLASFARRLNTLPELCSKP